ncbi:MULTISPECIES: arylamine N-acetyltransferase [unclassified Streptomyces]|uniref:arylamine N-acetyltransferase family protein n=1 Tax=unclassified Streptomyces TaxID=2593676 RepID=UPI002DDB2751|nr:MULTISPECIES: arylamine N-acetyltransferase [unclassified Streptomyces]WSA92747.1 arylamine N-acetyltransferase [Streptomyces sp. NBC_01795]WSB77118.1 arylamine N-acetyltransferase [Streptomyces sp. NBC_01775]WSS14616.1 arylamine N-acetyltransferase [Streptomyces sp. NBC_01186]WSS43430.1 arylamine N-acetyltransferase [Streptomyces sp. NBC_01187]
MWSGERLDLDAYLARLGYEGERAPTLETLRALHRAHVLSVRWDNLDSFLYRSVSLDLDDLQDKLVRRTRGGYCFEHAILYAAALERLGFRFTAVSGRVQLGAEKILPATHAMMLVELDGHRWLSDIGFGASPLAPIELVEGPAGNEVTVEGWAFWLRRQEVTPGADGWALHHGDGHGGWVLRHNFTENPQYPVDYELANHYVATGGHSPFNRRPFIQRARADRVDQLDTRTWMTTGPAHPDPYEKRELEPYELPKLLLDTFGIELSPEEAELLVGRVSELPD